MIGVGVGVRINAGSPAAAASHTYGPELWPQPTFAASAGLTLTHFSIAGNTLTADLSGLQANCDMTTPPTFVAADVYQYSITIATSGEGGLQTGLRIGGAIVNFLANATGTFTGTITVPGSPTQLARIVDADNSGGFTVTAMSLKKQLT